MRHKFLEDKIDFELSNPTLPEKLHPKIEIKPATYIYSFFRPYDYLAYDLVLNTENLIERPESIRAFYFDIAAKDSTDFESNAYWYVTLNGLTFPFTDIDKYNVYGSVDFMTLETLSNTFPVEDSKAYEVYQSPYIEFENLTLRSNDFVTIDTQMLNYVSQQDITNTERKNVEEIILFV